jgi:hypothetical protein
MVSCQDAWTLEKLVSRPRCSGGGSGRRCCDGVANERVAVDVAASSTRRDGVAAWRWRFPRSPCASAMT